jgi:hypothetical protein
MRQIAALSAFLVACGGEVTTTADAGSQQDTSVVVSDAMDNADQYVSPACVAEYKDLSALRSQATTCTTLAGACGTLVPDLCCPISVTDGTSADVQAFKAAVEKYKANCPYRCPNAGKIDPNTPCTNAPSNKCSGQVYAHCVQ